MVMSILLPLISALQEYGYPVLWLIAFASAVGAPLPLSLILLAAGAFAAQGDFDLALLIVITVTASVCGDNTGYLIGRRGGSKLLKWLEKPGKRKLVPANTITRSRASFKRFGGWAIFLSRFLFSALGGVINLISGAELYPYHRFLFYDSSGQVLGAVIPLSLGYIFGASWEYVADILGAFSGFALSLLLVIVLVIYLVKLVQRSRAETLSKNKAAASPSGPLPL
jgi:membrane-associated protein